MSNARGPFDAEGRPLGLGGAVAWMLLALFTLMLCAQLLAYMRPAAARDLVSLGIIDAAVYLRPAGTLSGGCSRSRAHSVRLTMADSMNSSSMPVR